MRYFFAFCRLLSLSRGLRLHRIGHHEREEETLTKLTLTGKFHLPATPTERDQVMATVHAYQAACNRVSALVYASRQLSILRLHQALYYDLRADYGLKAQMAASTFRTVVSAYKSAKTNGHPWTLVRFQKPKLELVYGRDYRLKRDTVSLNTLHGQLHLPLNPKGMAHFFDGTWKFGTATLVQKRGKLFLHIPFTKAFPALTSKDLLGIVGIDLGINFLATWFDDSGQTTFYNGRDLKNLRAYYKQLRRELQQRHTPSARKRLKAIGEREHRFMTDVNHRVTKALVTHYGPGTLFVLEDLTGVRAVTERVRRKHRYETVSWAFYQFRAFLTYKATKAGSQVLIVDPAYTSQDCPRCNHRDKANRDKKRHRFRCKNCGYQSNDDRVAAINLFAKGMKYLA